MRRITSSLAIALVSVAVVSAQTAVTPPSNKYSPADDVKLGLEAAAQARQEMPILQDAATAEYLTGIGRRLVAAIPPELRQPGFRYTFDVVNVSDINAFALPGGPMFVNRGMIEKSKTEGEMAGVMAHEISHVALRHGTAQASRATKYEIGSIAGQVLGAIIGGTAGQIVAQGSQFGIGAAFMRFSREYEKQADILGSHIMARAGYDPRDMASMFRTIEREGGGGAPQWLSDHPNPGNRAAYITEEAKALRVENPVRDTQAFDSTRARLARMPAAPTTEQVARAPQGGQPRGTTGTAPAGNVQPPSGSFRTVRGGDIFQVSVPSNWQQLSGNNTVTFAPQGAYGQGVFTHGVELGLTRNETHDLASATDELLQGLRQSNPRMQVGRSARAQLDGRPAMSVPVTNVSEVTGQPETIQVVTTTLPDGNLFYVVAVAPRAEASRYAPAFNQVFRSIRLAR